jgi:TFIIF-interacting CTD phosphatase-like protein
MGYYFFLAATDRLHSNLPTPQQRMAHPAPRASSSDTPNRKVLVIFDIDGVLVHRNAAREIEGRKADYRAGFKYVFNRPYLKNLLNFLKEHIEHLEVAFWTASEEHNAQKLIDGLRLPLYDIFPLFVWNREHCIKIDGPGYQTIKDIKKVYRTYPRFNEQTVIMFDDSPLKLNRIPNGFLVDTYIPCAETDASDRELLQVMEAIRKKI